MDVHKHIEVHRKQIDKAKVAICLGNYNEALVCLCYAYASNRQLIEQVQALMIATGQKLPTGTEISP